MIRTSKISILFSEHGFSCSQPSFTFGDLNVDHLPNSNSWNSSAWPNDLTKEKDVNLNSWNFKNFKALWHVHPETLEIRIFNNALQTLSNGLDAELSLTQSDSGKALSDMIKAFALGDYFIQTIIFKLEGNWLLREHNKEYHGLLKIFLFWLASIEMQGDTNVEKCLSLFMPQWAPDVKLEFLVRHTNDEIMSAFVKCFFHFSNDIEAFKMLLIHPEMSFYGTVPLQNESGIMRHN